MQHHVLMKILKSQRAAERVMYTDYRADILRILIKFCTVSLKSHVTFFDSEINPNSDGHSRNVALIVLAYNIQVIAHLGWLRLVGSLIL